MPTIPKAERDSHLFLIVGAIALIVIALYLFINKNANNGATVAPPNFGAANPGDGWQELSPAMRARSEGNLITHDGAVFHFNGFNQNLGVENTVERYDIENDTWQTVSETTDSPGFLNSVTHNGIVVIDNEAWLIGGRVGRHPGRVIDQVFIFDLKNYNWRDGPDLPVPFAGGGAALIDNKIHLFGGLDDDARCDVDTHLVYDLDNEGAGWQDKSATSPFPQPRNHFATVVLNEKIYVMGGQIGHDDCASLSRQRQQTDFVHVYDPQSDDWDRLSDLPWVNSHAEPSSFAHNGLIWSVGGVRNAERVVTYNPNNGSWSWRTALDLPRELLAPGARILGGNQLYVFGGGAPNTRSPRTETLVTIVPGLNADSSSDNVNVEPIDNNETDEEIIPVDDGLQSWRVDNDSNDDAFDEFISSLEENAENEDIADTEPEAEPEPEPEPEPEQESNAEDDVEESADEDASNEMDETANADVDEDESANSDSDSGSDVQTNAAELTALTSDEDTAPNQVEEDAEDETVNSASIDLSQTQDAVSEQELQDAAEDLMSEVEDGEAAENEAAGTTNDLSSIASAVALASQPSNKGVQNADLETTSSDTDATQSSEEPTNVESASSSGGSGSFGWFGLLLLVLCGARKIGRSR